MTVIQMSEPELTRLRVLIDLSDRRLTVEAASTLMGVGRRQVYRLRRSFAAAGAVALVSRQRGRASNHRHGETFHRTVLALVREHYPDFGPTLAAEKLTARHGLRLAPVSRPGGCRWRIAACTDCCIRCVRAPCEVRSLSRPPIRYGS